MKRIVVVIGLFFAILTLHGQGHYISVCVQDTLVLGVENYKHGAFQWEQSYDQENWFRVEGARDSILKIVPKANAFYRASVLLSDCDPLYSEVSLAQFSPQAHAGFNRVVSGNQVLLNANLPAGSTGQWQILSGDNGSFSDSFSHQTLFSGTDTLYVLSWTLTNACGSSTDEIEIRFKPLVFVDNIAVVDTTDVLLSTAREKAEGVYIIQFSEPVPQIQPNTLLIGMNDGGYLRIVEHVIAVDNLVTLQTRQADLEDLIVSGPLNLGEVLSAETLLRQGHPKASYRFLQRMPTRAELADPSLFSSDQIYFYPMGQSVEAAIPGSGLQLRDGSSSLVMIDMEYPDLIDSHGFKLSLSGNYEYNPNFVVDLDYGALGLRDLRIGSVNGVETKKMKISLEVAAGASLPDQKFSFASITKYYLIIVGAVPILVDVNFKIEGEFKAFAGGKIDFSHEVTETNHTNAYIQYKDKQWSYVYTKTTQAIEESKFEGKVVLEQEFSIGPVLSFKVYSVLGPYLEYKFQEELKLCVNPDLNWKATLDLSSNFKLGAKAIILGKEIVDFSRSWPRPIYSYEYPSTIHIWSGNNQIYTPGQAVEFNPRVQVKANNGVALPFARVLFRAGPGSEVSDSIVFANALGLAETSWTPGDSVQSFLEVWVLDCENKPIQHVPLQFVAHADTTNLCLNSSLALSVLHVDSILTPFAQMGAPPYQYAINGSVFFPEPMELLAIPGEIHEFLVKDKDDCIAAVSYTVPDPCLASDLSIDIVLLGDSVHVNASGGMPPYRFSSDGETFLSNPPQLLHSPGNVYHFFVQDALDCLASAWFAEPDVCEDFGLAFEWLITGNTLSIDPYGGFPPYSFMLNGEDFDDQIPQVQIVDHTPYVFKMEDQIRCVFEATFDPCEEFGFKLEIVWSNDLIVPEPSGGVPPYSYSMDGENYSGSVPSIDPLMGTTYFFYVMDQLGCVVMADYNLCYDSGLSLFLTIVDDEIIATASGGTPPYMYALNDTIHWLSNNVFSGLSNGKHTIYVKDANGCIGQAEAQKMDCGVEGIQFGSQCWMRKNLDVVTEMSFCYDDNPANCAAYGRLYSWEAAMNACPVGWRLPSRSDFEQLQGFLIASGFESQWEGQGNSPYENLLAKAIASKIPWQTTSNPNAPGNKPFSNNGSGFNGFPAGLGGWDEINNNPEVRVFAEFRRLALWWTTTTDYDLPGDRVFAFALQYDWPASFFSSSGRRGPLFNVRCVRNDDSGNN